MLDVAREHGRIVLFIGDKVHNLDPQDAVNFGEAVVAAAHAELLYQLMSEARRRADEGDFTNTDFVGL